MTANPQMFARAGAHADRTGREGDGSAHLRAQVSGMVIVPAGLRPRWGLFTAMYLIAAAAFIVCGIMVWLFLPSMRSKAGSDRPAGVRARIAAMRCCSASAP